MSKIICDICGTSYPDTADQCPICGYSREFNGDDILGQTQEQPEAQEEAVVEAAPVAAPVPKSHPVEEDNDDDDDYDEDDDDDDDEEPRSNTFLIVILVILIVALLAVSGYIFVKYFMPNMGTDESKPVESFPTESVATVETTEPRIACTGLTMTSDGNVVLDAAGNEWLLNVVKAPEDTTDKLLYSSSDESVATVNEAGKVTAVGQGEAVITITCGEQLLQCKVTCFFIGETTAPEGTSAPETFADETTAATEASTAPVEETTAPNETEAPKATEAPEETEAPKTEDGEVTLTLSRTDISFGVVPAFYTLEIEEDIDPKDVKWSSSNGDIVIVHDGELQVVGYGICKVYAKYKGVTAVCIVRVVK